MTADQELDALGLLCPLPVLKARKRLAGMAKGEVLAIICDDPATLIDMPHYCQEAGHVLLSHEEIAGNQRFLIRKG